MAKQLFNEYVAIDDKLILDYDSGLSFFVEDESQNLKLISNQIQKDIADMKLIANDLNKMREKAAQLELNLSTTVNGSTWKDVSDLIGLSSTMMMNECMKILAPDDCTTWNVTK